MLWPLTRSLGNTVLMMGPNMYMFERSIMEKYPLITPFTPSYLGTGYNVCFYLQNMGDNPCIIPATLSFLQHSSLFSRESKLKRICS